MYSTIKKSIAVLLMIAVSGCGAVLQNPEINNAEFQRELKKQSVLLKVYKKKNINPADSKSLFKTVYEYDAYLANIMDTILVDNVELCANTMYTIGMQYAGKVVVQNDTVPKRYRSYPQVYGLTDNFPAVKSGLKKGDVILGINAVDIRTMKSERIVRTLHTRKSNTFRVYRPSNSEKYTITARGKAACQMLLYTHQEKSLNATADGTIVRMYSGLLNFLGKKEYIQTVLAHEVAHNILGHRSRIERNRATGALLGTLIGVALSNGKSGSYNKDLSQSVGNLGVSIASLKYSHEFEAEADYLGVYLLARSGYNFKNVHNTWRRMSLLSDSSGALSTTTTHPAVPKRFVALTKTIKEINKKIKAKKPLLPTFKESSWSEIKKQQKALF